ncbi:MAG: hypothetical protein JST62_14365 [Bacteroidetes bacterium]|nr:hypothetical protein [Bacteroidota bacterium]
MKKFLLLFLGIIVLGFTTSCRKDDNSENPALYTNADKYVKDSDGERYTLDTAQLIGVKAQNNTQTNQYTIILSGTVNGVLRKIELVQSFPFNDKLEGGFSTTSTIRNISKTQSKYTRGTTVINTFDIITSSIVDMDSHNFKVIFSIKTQGGEVITGAYTGQFQVDIN